MLKLFGEIDERKQQLQKARKSWQKATQLASQQKPIFDRALEIGDYKSACDIAYRLWGTAKELPPNLECATGFVNKVEIKWVDPLTRAVDTESNKIETLLNQAKSQIADCKLAEAEKNLRQAQQKSASLWTLKENYCQQSSGRQAIMQKIASLDQKLNQAKATVCGDKESKVTAGGFSATCIFKSKTKKGLEIGRRLINASSREEMDTMIRQHCTTDDFNVTVEHKGKKKVVHTATCIFLSKTKKGLEIGRRSVNASSKEEMDTIIRQHCTTNDFHVKIKFD
jgi:cell division septum initiation protein DivIVA